MTTLREVEKDVAAVEGTLLTLVVQACPDDESRASRLGAARCLITYAQMQPPWEGSQIDSSHEGLESDAFPAEVLRSCSALQPLLGQAGVLDAYKVLRALHCRIQHLKAEEAEAGQPQPCSRPCGSDLASSDLPQDRSPASDAPAAAASAAAAVARKTEGAGCITTAIERGAISCSAQEVMRMSNHRVHDASESREDTAQTNFQAQTPEGLNSEHREQHSESAQRPLQYAAKVRLCENASLLPVSCPARSSCLLTAQLSNMPLSCTCRLVQESSTVKRSGPAHVQRMM